MMHVPAATIWAAAAVAVQTAGVVDVNTTGFPDAPPVAARAKLGAAGAVKVIVCAPFAMMKV